MKAGKNFMDVTFYSTHCPKCKVLEIKLKQAGISYVENDNVEEMRELGINAAPALKVDDQLLDFSSAIKWISGRS